MKKIKDKKDPQETKKKWLLILLLLLLLTAGSYFVYQKFFKTTEPVTVISGDFLPKGKDANKISDEELKKYAQTTVDSSNFNMVISSKADISASNMTGSLLIQNPPQNAYPINVEIRLDDSGDLIYTSGAIQPGEEIKQVTLDKNLEPGSYKSTATFSLYNAETKEKKGQVSAGVTFTIQ